MDKASASGAGDSRFESWADHEYCSMMHEARGIGVSGLSRFFFATLPANLHTCLDWKTLAICTTISRQYRTRHVSVAQSPQMAVPSEKLEFNIRYSTSWLGYSALTRATRVRVPVAELLCRSCCLLLFLSMPQQDPAATHRKPRDLQ
jgi:hypothetical protein